MELISTFFNMLLHIDKYLDLLVHNYGGWTYLIIFLIVFCETGLVITPFLPGDSLLFVIGALGASGIMDIKLAMLLLLIAAFSGNMTNYFIGRFIGTKAFDFKDGRLFKKRYLIQAHDFYEKYGGKTIFLSRFLPIIRTFAPFVGGISRMTLWRFMLYNFLGALCWILVFMLAGYFFGNIPVVEKNFSLIVLGIIVVTILPSVFIALRQKFSRVRF
ncbi:DedA family protein [Dehalobacter sp. DCM]|uniref:DedA family protein n=1 Tax=Dehalobacter sp. DCM TaxID=2907827 RepID=UPI003081FFE2|nr:DedA family protein [Dehalobacter sp. DCM]